MLPAFIGMRYDFLANRLNDGWYFGKYVTQLMLFPHAQQHVNVVAHMALNDRVKKMFTILRVAKFAFRFIFFHFLSRYETWGRWAKWSLCMIDS